MPPVKIEKEPNKRLLLLEVLGCLVVCVWLDIGFLNTCKITSTRLCEQELPFIYLFIYFHIAL